MHHPTSLTGETSRPLLYFHGPDSPSLPIETMEECGWKVVPITDIEHLAQRLEKLGPCVGLVNLPCDDEKRCTDQLEALFNDGTVTWVALLPPTFDEHPDICRLVYRFCFDYLTLPFDLQRMLNTLGHAHGMRRLKSQFVDGGNSPLLDDEIIGNCPEMRFVKEKIGRIALVNAPILIGGESGTGKELVARAIHNQSDRANGGFEAVNCAALPPTLIQSELFGHERGAFTGAHQRKIGRFESANGGTLFLDEIGDLPLELQVVLLRVLEQGTLRRLGAVDDTPIDIRIIAATHVDLEKAVTEGRFREDLYYRLNVLNIDLPPLRERGDDIALLTRNFVTHFAGRNGTPPPHLTTQALQLLHHYDWPGNVRELINRIQRALVMCEHSLIKPADLGLERRTDRRYTHTLEEARNRAERDAILQALKRNIGQVTATARDLGISRTTLYRLMEKHRIDG